LDRRPRLEVGGWHKTLSYTRKKVSILIVQIAKILFHIAIVNVLTAVIQIVYVNLQSLKEGKEYEKKSNSKY